MFYYAKEQEKYFNFSLTLSPSLFTRVWLSVILSPSSHHCMYVCGCVRISWSTAEWQVMCVFKALHVNPNDQHSELREAEFYDFYEVQNLKWREVKSTTTLTRSIILKRHRWLKRERTCCGSTNSRLLSRKSFSVSVEWRGRLLWANILSLSLSLSLSLRDTRSSQMGVVQFHYMWVAILASFHWSQNKLTIKPLHGKGGRE